MSTPIDLSELIQADIDGVASEADRARLQALLAADPAAREEHRRLLALRNLLGTIPPVAPPAPLRADIMRAVRTERARARGGLLRKLFPSWEGGRSALPYAYAMAAGAALGLLGLHFWNGGATLGPDAVERDAAATIGASVAGTEAGRISLHAGGVDGAAVLRSIDGNLALEVDFPAEGVVDVRLAFDPAAVRFVGVSNRTGGVDRLEMADGTVRWSQSLPQRVTVFLAPRTRAASKLEVHVRNDGGVEGGGSLDVPGVR